MRMKFLLATATGLSLFFTSCKKDGINEEQALSGETVSSEANAYDATIETAAPTYTSVVTNVNANVAGFWQAVPSLYSKTTKSYPLILFIHGIGELGTDIGSLNCCGLPNVLYNKRFPANFKVGSNNFSYIVMAPQFKVRPSAADVQSAIDYMKARYRIDASRIYVTGLSMGGGSTWDWSAVYGQNAAAIVPVCGGTAPTDALCRSIASKNLPIWGIYSYKDAVVPASWGTTFFSLIDKYNPSYAGLTKLTIYSDVDHNHTWGRAFDPASRVDGYSIYEWMLLYTRGGAASVPPTTSPTPTSPTTGNTAPIARAGADQTVPASWNWFPTLNATTSTDADGYIAKFMWSQVSGPSTVTLSTPGTGQTKVTGWKTGTYVFRVAVTDNKGAVSYDDVAITISATATSATSGSSGSSTTTTAGAPIARAGNDQSVPKSWNWFPTLNANFSTDSDGYIAKFTWSQVSGPNTVTLVTPNTGQTKVTGWTVGTYVFRVAVTDNSGKVSYDDVAITITNN